MCLILMFWGCILSATHSVPRVEMMCYWARGGYLPLLASPALFLNPDSVLYFQKNISECCH